MEGSLIAGSSLMPWLLVCQKILFVMGFVLTARDIFGVHGKSYILLIYSTYNLLTFAPLARAYIG